MNNLYFGCTDCRIYIDAGYRWAYCELERDAKVVSRGQPVDVKSVLGAESFWNPPDDPEANWLHKEILPSLKEFFAAHDGHCIVFGNREHIIIDDAEEFEWMQIGHLLEPTPRYFVEVLGLRSWDEAADFMDSLSCSPWWWGFDHPEALSTLEQAKRKMEQLLAGSPRPGE